MRNVIACGVVLFGLLLAACGAARADAMSVYDHGVSAPPGGRMPSASLIVEARRHLGATGRQLGMRHRAWCAEFLNAMLKRTGRRGTGSALALSFARYGVRVAGPQVGAIAVMRRGRRGGHVGIVAGVDARGNPILISGNHNRRVAESVYPRARIVAYVRPL